MKEYTLWEKLMPTLLVIGTVFFNIYCFNTDLSKCDAIDKEFVGCFFTKSFFDYLGLAIVNATTGWLVYKTFKPTYAASVGSNPAGVVLFLGYLAGIVSILIG
jgi:hypothetical protein